MIAPFDATDVAARTSTQPLTAVDLFDNAVGNVPDRACLVEDGGDVSVTYADLQRRTMSVARALQAAGLGPGSVVCTLSLNTAAAFACALGALRAGCVWAPLNARATAKEIDAILRSSGCAALFFQGGLSGSINDPAVTLPPIAVCLDTHPSRPSLEDWLGSADPGESVGAVAVDADQTALLWSTSGTTGAQRFIELSHANLTWMIVNTALAMPGGNKPVHLVSAPMTHAAGIFTFPLLAQGATHVIQPTVDAGAVLAAIPKYGVTHLYLPPTALYALLAHPDIRRHDYSSLRFFMYAAAPSSAAKVKEAIEVFGPVMTQSYGQAEGGPISFLSPADHLRALAGEDHLLSSCGRPALITQVAVLDDTGHRVPAGESGEIAVRGPQISPGYRSADGLVAVVDASGWLRTGDIGRQDREGYLYVTDRSREVIISGGFNIFPAEVEQVLLSHPAVLDCAVIGVPHARWGEAIHAVIQLKAGLQLTADEAIALCREHLGGVKTPKTVEFRADLPRSEAGKVLRRALRDEHR